MLLLVEAGVECRRLFVRIAIRFRCAGEVHFRDSVCVSCRSTGRCCLTVVPCHDYPGLVSSARPMSVHLIVIKSYQIVSKNRPFVSGQNQLHLLK